MENLIIKGTSFSEDNYEKMINALFVRFPSFQKVGAGAYKPGLDRMEFFDSLTGHPHKKYRTIHIAGTNGKGSVANMLAAVLAASGKRVGVYTSPHILDFRERIKVVAGDVIPGTPPATRVLPCAGCNGSVNDTPAVDAGEELSIGGKMSSASASASLAARLDAGSCRGAGTQILKQVQDDRESGDSRSRDDRKAGNAHVQDDREIGSGHVQNVRESGDSPFQDDRKQGRGHVQDDREAGGGHFGLDPESADVNVEYISKKYVWDYVRKWGETFDHLEMSFFEITTAMAFSWFADRNVDIAVIETGLGGRLDSTNIITPQLSVITNIGLDHCDLLGDTLPEIAFEKAGIIKPEVPVVVGESNPETDPVFERKVLYTNLPSPAFMGDRSRIMSLLTFADKVEPPLWKDHAAILRDMDLRGEYQEKNLRTVLAAIDVLKPRISGDALLYALEHTASITGFHGRWEKLSDDPYIICDIGHNAHGLKYNFHQLGHMLSSGECTSLIVIYGSVSDKDYESVFPLMPENATYVFTGASSRRALPAGTLKDRYLEFCGKSGRPSENVYCAPSVGEAMSLASGLYRAAQGGKGSADGKTAGPLIYIGGSTYVVAEAAAILVNR